MQKMKTGDWLGSDRKVIFLIFLLFTLIATLQFLQYFIAYNSSYPFPWRWNLGLTYGTFYSYFPFVPLILQICRRLKSDRPPLKAWLLVHFLMALAVGIVHLAIVNWIEWVQVKSFTEVSYFTSYRWKLARYLHLEVLMYSLIAGIWYVVQLLRWRRASKGQTTAELEVSKPRLSRLKVKNGRDVSFIDIAQIRWLEAYDNYVKCRVADRFVLVRATLTGLEKDLDPTQFNRIHRSCIVAINEVAKIRSSEGKYEVLLHDGTALKLSKTYKKRIEDLLATNESA